ncbi:hypothetical protein ZIOFF_039807 [Zingiber officinale]|uniref:Inhibitor I9 domain-containing protein n=1 Tax=Zingiber officinale TaxID=94328 RepID=A0A8J5GCW2_ZINOF|nr:hypothetical protein ZIOFF_039807 [Zingiber officinale]
MTFPSCFLLLILALTAAAAAAEAVGMAEATAAASGASRKKIYIFRVDHLAKPSVFPTLAHWYASAAFSIGAADPLPLLHVYDTVFHGFSASLSEIRAVALAAHPNVLAVFEDRVRHPDTTRSPQFLGLRNQVGLWSDSDYGSDVIVGVLDTGVWPERRSFSDRNLGPVPSRWRGACETGPGFPASLCNRKLIGARFFSKGHDAAFVGGGGAGINETGLVGDAHILPACAVGSAEGEAIKTYAASVAAPTATIQFKGTVVGVRPAPVVASFSGRGPNGIAPAVLKPDIIAPGDGTGDHPCTSGMPCQEADHGGPQLPVHIRGVRRSVCHEEPEQDGEADGDECRGGSVGGVPFEGGGGGHAGTGHQCEAKEAGLHCRRQETELLRDGDCHVGGGSGGRERRRRRGAIRLLGVVGWGASGSESNRGFVDATAVGVTVTDK